MNSQTGEWKPDILPCEKKSPREKCPYLEFS